MKFQKRTAPLCILPLACCCAMVLCGWLFAQDDGLAPELTDLNAKDVSMAWEKQIPYLEKPHFSTRPADLDDGIRVGELGVDGGAREMILAFAREVAMDPNQDRKDKTDSLLISHKGKLIFESYFR